MTRLLLTAVAVVATAMIARADVTLVENCTAMCVIVADAAVMAADKPAPPKFAEAEAERQRQRLRESVKDLAHYLGKMSGAKVEIITAAPKADDKRVRVLVGAPAVAAFGPSAKTAPYKQDAPDKTRRRVIGTLACFGSGGVGLGFWERLRLGFGPR